MANLLFDNTTFLMECPEPFNDTRITRESTTHYSMYNTVSAKRSTLHAPTLRAIMAYMKLSKAFTDGESLDGLGAIGKAGDKRFVAEYISGRGEIQAVSYYMPC